METTRQQRAQRDSGTFSELLNTLRWTRASFWLFSGFLLLLFLIGYVWQPLVVEYLSYFHSDIPIWRQIDHLLVGNFLFMTIMIMANANLKKDLPILAIGMVGGLAIEGWGTQTELWTYYTFERPPLWIIPAWPIASLSIDRLHHLLRLGTRKVSDRVMKGLYWGIFPVFLIVMLQFVAPTFQKSLTVLATTLVILLIFAIKDYRGAVLTFIAGSGLGYFLELCGTTRLCWTYYTLETPPVFAIVAHGMAAVAFWWGFGLYQQISPRLTSQISPDRIPHTDR